MLLTIRHETVYRYAVPVTLLPHRMMMHPRGQHDSTVRSAELTCSPAGRLDWTQDVFGNVVATATFDAPVMRLTVTSQLLIEQSAAAWPVFSIAPQAHAFPFAYGPDECVDLGVFLQPQHPDPEERLRRWTRGFVAATPTDTLSLLKDINGWIGSHIVYRERDEEGTQAPWQTIALGTGSCRDLATLFIEAVRHLGIGARAVSGYLFIPDDETGDAQHRSTHAWAEVYLPGAGWIVFDPTNGRVGGADLIPVAVARNITQIMPLAGSYLGEPADFLDMHVEVSVTRLQVP